MVQTALTGGAYVHTGTLTDSFKTLKHLDLIRAVFALYLCHFFFIDHIDGLDGRIGSVYELLYDFFDGSDFFILLIQDNSSVLHDSKVDSVPDFIPFSFCSFLSIHPQSF